MKMKNLAAAFLAVVSLSILVSAQGTVVISDPTVNQTSAEMDSKYKLLPGEQRMFDTLVLPKVRERLAGDECEEEIGIFGNHQGYFTQSKQPENLIFYQFCQTGNGMGKAGLVIFRGERLIGNFIAENAGWTNDSRILPDINKNGLDEIALYYSGGMHQGEGGTGCDIVEYSAGKLKGIGWYQSDGFSADDSSWSFKVSVNPGKTPVFFKQKYIANSSDKWRKSGKVLPLKLGKIFATFVAI